MRWGALAAMLVLVGCEEHYTTINQVTPGTGVGTTSTAPQTGAGTGSGTQSGIDAGPVGGFGGAGGQVGGGAGQGGQVVGGGASYYCGPYDDPIQLCPPGQPPFAFECYNDDLRPPQSGCVESAQQWGLGVSWCCPDRCAIYHPTYYSYVCGVGKIGLVCYEPIDPMPSGCAQSSDSWLVCCEP